MFALFVLVIIFGMGIAPYWLYRSPAYGPKYAIMVVVAVMAVLAIFLFRFAGRF